MKKLYIAVLIFTFLAFNVQLAHADVWYSTNWSLRIPINISVNNPSDLIYVTFPSSEVPNCLATNCTDIRITADKSTIIPYQIIVNGSTKGSLVSKWTGRNQTSGNIVIAFQPLNTTNYYIYYGASGVSDMSSFLVVWEDDFRSYTGGMYPINPGLGTFRGGGTTDCGGGDCRKNTIFLNSTIGRNVLTNLTYADSFGGFTFNFNMTNMTFWLEKNGDADGSGWGMTNRILNYDDSLSGYKLVNQNPCETSAINGICIKDMDTLTTNAATTITLGYTNITLVSNGTTQRGYYNNTLKVTLDDANFSSGSAVHWSMKAQSGVGYASMRIFNTTVIPYATTNFTAGGSETNANLGITVSIIAPTASTFLSNNLTATFNATSTLDASFTCTKTLDGTLTTIGTVANSTITSNFLGELGIGSHSLNITCKDSVNNGTALVTFSIIHWNEISQGYQTSANETQSQTFNVTIQTAGNVKNITGNFIHSNIANNITISNLNSTLFLLKSTINVPLVDVNASLSSFNWTYSIQYINSSSSSQQTSTTNNQNVTFSYFIKSLLSSINPADELSVVYMNVTSVNLSDAASVAVNLSFGNTLYKTFSTANASNLMNFSAGVTMIAGNGILATSTVNWNATLYVTFNGVTKARISSTTTQDITTIGLQSSCSPSATRILNLSFYDEETNKPFAQPFVNDTSDILEAYITVYKNNLNDFGASTRNYTFNFTQSNSYAICMLSNTSSFNIDADIRYYNTTTYTLARFYYFRDQPVSNITQYYNLYLLQDSLSTGIPFTIKETNGVDLASNVIVVAERQILQNGTFIPVAMTLTSSAGQGFMYLHAGTVNYEFLLYRNGVLLNTISPSVIQTIASTNGLVFSLGSATLSDILNVIQRTTGTCPVVNGILTCTYSDPTGSLNISYLTVVKDGIVSKVQVCQVSNTSKSASLSCNLTSQGNGTFYYQLGAYFKDASTGTLFWSVIEDGTFAPGLATPYGTEGLVFAVILILVFVMIGSFNPVVSIFMGITALAISVAMQMVVISEATMIGIIIVGIITAIKAKG